MSGSYPLLTAEGEKGGGLEKEWSEGGKERKVCKLALRLTFLLL